MVNNTDTSYNIIVTYDSNSELFYFSGNDETEVELINEPKNTLYFKTNSAIYFDLSFSSNNDISFVISNFNDNIIDEGSNGSTLEISSNSYVFYKFGSTNVTNNSSGVIEIFSTTILNRENLVDILNKKKNIIDDPNTISDTQKFNTDKRRFLGNFNYIVSDNRNLVTDSSGIVDDMIIESITSDLHLVTTDDRKIHFWSGETIVEDNLIIKGNLVMDYNKLEITISNEFVARKMFVDNSFTLYTQTSELKSGNLDLSFNNVDISGNLNILKNLDVAGYLKVDGSNVALQNNVDASIALYTQTSELKSGNLDLSFNNVDILGNLQCGYNTIASGNHSAAFGKDTLANANQSTAFGRNTIANGLRSTTFGLNTIANGNQSAAFGVFTYAEGNKSSAFGLYTNASGENSLVCGHYNHPDANKIFIIGCGDDENTRKNALTVDYSGNLDVAGYLKVDGSNVAIKDNVDASFALYTQTNELKSGNLDLSFQNVDISGTLNFNIIDSVGDISRVNMSYIIQQLTSLNTFLQDLSSRIQILEN